MPCDSPSKSTYFKFLPSERPNGISLCTHHVYHFRVPIPQKHQLSIPQWCVEKHFFCVLCSRNGQKSRFGVCILFTAFDCTSHPKITPVGALLNTPLFPTERTISFSELPNGTFYHKLDDHHDINYMWEKFQQNRSNFFVTPNTGRKPYELNVHSAG